MSTTIGLRERVAYCADRLEASAQLALLAARGPDPIYGAEFLLDTIEDLAADLRVLRGAVRRHQR